MSISEVSANLRKHNSAPDSTIRFAGAWRAMNRATHGLKLDAGSVADVVNIRNESLTEIKDPHATRIDLSELRVHEGCRDRSVTLTSA